MPLSFWMYLLKKQDLLVRALFYTGATGKDVAEAILSYQKDEISRKFITI